MLDFDCPLDVEILDELILFTGAFEEALSVLFVEALLEAVTVLDKIFCVAFGAVFSADDLTALVFAVTTGFFS